MDELLTTKLTILSCIFSKYDNVCGTPNTRPFILTGCTVIVALGTIKLFLQLTASGTPIECPPPSTNDAVGVFIVERSSAIASPASTSPPTVFKIISKPSISLLSSIATSCGITCSYLVVLFWLGRI